MDPNPILSFWFGNDERSKYKTRWFPSGDATAERRADDDIEHQFGGQFVEILEAYRSTVPSLEGLSVYQLLALIILTDQFSRHIFRLKQVPMYSNERQQADELALIFAEELTSRNDWDVGLTVSQYVFALMPLRHSANVARLEKVMRYIELREVQHEWSAELLQRFRKQTTRRLQHLQDRAKAEDNDDILEHEAFDADESSVMQEPLVTTVREFLLQHHTSSSDKTLDSIMNPVSISLSGGVDSMVISKILCLLRDRCPKIGQRLAGGAVVAIHIDYANRPESGREADYVQSWSQKLDMAFHKRVVDEVTRGVTDRSIYERVSRDARYDFYRKVLLETGSPGVIFGHHQGDVQENVISNVMHGVSPLQLSGMEAVGMSNNVSVWRPLLQHSKVEIFAFAHKYGVPYFKDTTPSWSTRGKLRTLLVPLLIDMYGNGCLSNLSNLAAESDRTRELVNANIFKPFLSDVNLFPCGLAVNILPYRMQPLSFWREALKQLMHSLSMSMVRGRAIGTFLERIQGKPQYATSKMIPRVDGEWGPPGWLELRKGFDVEIGSDGLLVIFHENVLSYSASHSGPNNIHLDRSIPSSEHAFSPWKVTLTWIEQSSDVCNQIQEKTLRQARDVLVGEFSYVLALHKGCSELVIMSSLRGGRKTRAPPPTALTGVDLRLRAGLPLLVPRDDDNNHDGCAESEIDSEQNFLLIKFKYCDNL